MLRFIPSRTDAGGGMTGNVSTGTLSPDGASLDNGSGLVLRWT
jgi:hypothetical protein